jgi:hypothetical protein
MPERVRLERTKPKSKSMILASARMKLFGVPQLLEGEDADAYDELLARIRAAVKPIDIVEEMWGGFALAPLEVGSDPSARPRSAERVLG